ncbi:MAG: hypothetical protein GX111_05120 [Clostridiales bacterium]|nr:hypothetical protein [Clostridiales bacterium]
MICKLLAMYPVGQVMESDLDIFQNLRICNDLIFLQLHHGCKVTGF